MNQSYLCIDLKSYYASVECVDRGLDPFTANLVVADRARGMGALCLAVSPALKALGVRNRCRLFEIPRGIPYLIAPPRMQHYMDVSTEIYKIYLKFLAPEDIFPYSIDECFMDVTPYLAMYAKTPTEMAISLMNQVYQRTDIWQIAGGTARRLAKIGVYDLYGITRIPEATLYRLFGKNAAALIDHAWGREPCTLSDIRTYSPRSRSISAGQILFENYTSEDARILLHEMAETLIQELLEKGLVTREISLRIGYAGEEHASSGGSRRLPSWTDIPSRLQHAFSALYEAKVRREIPIRSLNLSLGRLAPAGEGYEETSLFGDAKAEAKERTIEKVMIEIKKKHGKNAMLRGIDYMPKATLRLRNTLIGGHHA